jgi:hypothetical protein
LPGIIDTMGGSGMNTRASAVSGETVLFPQS